MARRGIGNVIATVVMLFLVIFTVSQLYIYNLNQLDSYNQVAQGVFATDAQKQNEHITISNVALHPTTGTTYVDVTITNSGGVTAHIVTVWIDDVVFATSPHTRIPENIVLGQGLSTTVSGLNTGVLSSLNHPILVKVFTELGNSASVELLPPGQGGTTTLTTATTQMTLIPPNPITSNDIIVVLTVTNTNSLGVAFTSLTPDICVVQGKIQPTISTLDSGTASGGSTTTLSVSGSPWSSNQWVGDMVYITAGTGVGQTARITANTANQLTINPSWAVSPDSTSAYVVRADCHGSAPTLDSGTAASVGINTLTDGSKGWTIDQWKGYSVTITSGTGAVQTGTITGNTATQLTVGASWSPAIAAGSKYSIQISNCSAGTGVTTSAPVSCTLVQGPNPSSLNFLPPGGTIQFQWIYALSSLLPDSPITFLASYVNTTTTIGLISSPPSQNQMPFQVATVRAPGGASSSSGGTLASVLGFIQLQYSTTNILVRSSQTDVGPWPSSQWSSNLQVSRSSYLVFRVQVTNTGTKAITLAQNTAVFAERLTTPSFVQFYIVYCNASCQANPSTAPIQAYGGANTVTIQLGDTATLYFAVQNAGGDPTSNPQAQKLTNTDTFLLVIAVTGTLNTSPTTNYSQAIPFVAVQAT